MKKIQISPKIWKNIQNDVENYVEATGSESERQRKSLLKKINYLIKKHPDSIDLLATKADYLKQRAQQEKCLLSAFAMAERFEDYKNQTLISSSLAVLYIEDARNYSLGAVWVGKLKNALSNYYDKDEQQTLEELEGSLAFLISSKQD